VFHLTLDHDRERPLVALSGWRIGNSRAGLLGILHGLVEVFNLEIRPHDRPLMRRQRLPDADQRSVRLSRDTRLPKVRIAILTYNLDTLAIRAS
jgi:hypothetical protein